MATHKRHGGIAGAGIGLLALLITIAIMVWMFASLAEVQTQQSADAMKQGQDIKQKAHDMGVDLQKMMDERAQEAQRAATQP